MSTSQRPKPSVIRTPIETAAIPQRVRRSSAAISLGRSLPNAARLKTPAITAPPRKRKAPVMCRNSAQSYFDTAGTLRSRTDGSYNRRMEERERHLRLLTETIAAVNSTLDLEEVLELVA